MFYEVRARIYYTSEDEARDFYHDCALALIKGTVVNTGEQNEQFAFIELFENYHDSDPNEPCILLTSANNMPPQPD